MTKKNKEERIEKIIRGLLILPENRRCINCDSLGPQYLCTNFFTFVCTNCSGTHNQQKVRDFIKHVYVDRRYTGEKSQEKLPLLKLTDKEESGEKRWVVLYSGGSRSPNYGWSEGSGFSGRADDKTIKYYYDERRSPRYYSQENSRCGGFMKSPVHFDVVDDRFRDDGI